MIVVGLTGGIAMGKSTVAAQFKRLGAHTFSADAIAHALLSAGGEGVEAVGRAFPAAREGDAISRTKLGSAVFGNPEKLKTLEAILHPLVRKEEARLVRAARRHGARIVVIEIPLLFETKAEKRLDVTVAVSAPRHVQKRRALKRREMTEEKLIRILSRQLMDHARKRKADFVIHTGLGFAYSFRQTQAIIHTLLACAK